MTHSRYAYGIRDYIKHESFWILLGGTLKTL